MIKYDAVKIIQVDDFDALVQETYKRPYNFQQQDGCKDRQTFYFDVPYEYVEDYPDNAIPEQVNGTKMGVSFKAWLDRNPEQKLNTDDDWEREYGIQIFWERNFYPSFGMVINDLHNKGLIEAGSYGIEIDW